MGYYRQFIKGLSKIAAPLNKLSEKDKPFIWTEECTKAYQELKNLLLKEPVVAILAQKQEGRERIICCTSRTLNKSEQNYSATKKECLAVVWGIKNFHNYLIVNHFKVYTDHYSLQWLRSMKNESALLHRWAAQLEDYDSEILHQPGKNQGHVDALSRLPMDKVQFLGLGKTVLQTAEDTAQVVERIHQDGHLRIKKTLKFFRRRFEGVWEKTLCQAIVSSCEGCQLDLDYKPRSLPQGKIESVSPWDVLSIDVMGPFISGRKGEPFILSVVDCFSRYLILIPIKDHNATTVSQALYKRVVGYFGCPRKILSDRGTEFTGYVGGINEITGNSTGFDLSILSSRQ